MGTLPVLVTDTTFVTRILVKLPQRGFADTIVTTVHSLAITIVIVEVVEVVEVVAVAATIQITATRPTSRDHILQGVFLFQSFVPVFMCFDEAFGRILLGVATQRLLGVSLVLVDTHIVDEVFRGQGLAPARIHAALFGGVFAVVVAATARRRIRKTPGGRNRRVQNHVRRFVGDFAVLVLFAEAMGMDTEFEVSVHEPFQIAVVARLPLQPEDMHALEVRVVELHHGRNGVALVGLGLGASDYAEEEYIYRIKYTM